MKQYRKLVPFICFLSLSIMVGLVTYKKYKSHHRFDISLEGQPLIGEGKMQMVVFEDFSCAHCKEFTLTILPKLYQTYVLTDKASLALIPVCFSEGSKPSTNAALTVYEIAKDRFLDFVTGVVEKRPFFKKDILDIALAIGGIDLEELALSIDQKLNYSKIDHNLDIAIDNIGPDFGTPMLFCNGISIPLDSFETASENIQKIGGY